MVRVSEVFRKQRTVNQWSQTCSVCRCLAEAKGKLFAEKYLHYRPDTYSYKMTYWDRMKSALDLCNDSDKQVVFPPMENVRQASVAAVFNPM